MKMTFNMLSKDIATYIDDLLVEAKIEQPRRETCAIYVPYSCSTEVTPKIKQAPRVKVILNFEHERAFFAYKHHECYYNLKTNKIISHRDIASSAKLTPFVIKAVQKFQQDIQDARESYQEYKDWEIIRNNESDNCSGKDNFDGCGNAGMVSSLQYRDKFSPKADWTDVFGIDKTK